MSRDWKRPVTIGTAAGTISAAATPEPYAADPALTYPDGGTALQPMAIDVVSETSSDVVTYRWLVGDTMVAAILTGRRVIGRHAHRTWFEVAGGEVAVRVTTAPHTRSPRDPVYTQLLAGIDADIERIRRLRRTALELLGERPRRGV